MLTYHDIERLSNADRVVTWASHDYYQALLRGASEVKRRQLRQMWLCALRSRWPELAEIGLCGHCPAPEMTICIVRQRRYRMIAEAAYYRAAQRSFQGGNPEQDWLEAEREIDQIYFNSSRLLCG